MNQKRVAFIGKRHVGKSTAAFALFDAWDERCFARGTEACAQQKKLSFSDPLKDAYVVAFRAFEEAIGQSPRFTRDELDKHKDQHRTQLEEFGTKFGRNRFGETIWLDLMEANLEEQLTQRNTVFAVDDCRFMNEAALLRRYDFTLVSIQRDEQQRGRSILLSRGITNPTKEQVRAVLEEQLPSEREVDAIECDLVIHNDGTERFAKRIRELI